MKIDKRSKYDWTKADWSLLNAGVARQMGSSEAMAGRARKLYAPATHRPRVSSVALTNRGDVTEFLAGLKPGMEFWLPGDSKKAWETLQCGSHRLDIDARCQTFDASPRRKSYGPARQVTLVTILAVRDNGSKRSTREGGK